MKFPPIISIPTQLNSEPSEADLRYMDDDCDDYPSQQNLQTYMNTYDSAKDLSAKEKGSAKAENIQNKISKKKPVAKESKGASSANSMQIKRTQSHNRNSSINFTKLYSKKSSEFRQIKLSQFQCIYKTFSIFSCHFVTFNELILGLKSLGVQIQTEKKFQIIKNNYDEFVGKNDAGIDFEMFAKIAIRLLKEEKSRANSDLFHIEKGFYYMVQEANKVQWPFDKEEQSRLSGKELYNEFKRYVDQLPSDERCLTKESLANLAKYLGLEKELTPKEIETIMKFADKEDKGYLSLEDVIRCINGNKIVDV